MNLDPAIASDILTRLLKEPGGPCQFEHAGVRGQARIAIHGYRRLVADHYRALLPDGIVAFAQQSALDTPFEHFGVGIEFARPTIIGLHDDEFHLDDGWRALLQTFGPVLFRNATTDERFRDAGQRNIFPDLEFHIDRGRTQPNRISMFFRDPRDPRHVPPRQTSTLFVANLVAHLQASQEGPSPSPGQHGKYGIFRNRDIGPLLGRVILEQPWTAPAGTPEMAILDNATVVHASHYRPVRSYPIGVRYLY